MLFLSPFYRAKTEAQRGQVSGPKLRSQDHGARTETRVCLTAEAFHCTTLLAALWDGDQYRSPPCTRMRSHLWLSKRCSLLQEGRVYWFRKQVHILALPAVEPRASCLTASVSHLSDEGASPDLKRLSCVGLCTAHGVASSPWYAVRPVSFVYRHCKVTHLPWFVTEPGGGREDRRLSFMPSGK